MIYKKVKELYPQIKTIANEHVEKNWLSCRVRG